ncbi:MAG: glucose-1-phosphate adenylyltransferase [Bryobacteraceae bacterium]
MQHVFLTGPSSRVLTILLAGGAGERLGPLTRDEPKPMMPFGGIYRLIDITLSNCVNSGLTRIFILTQYKALSLNRHVREAWNILSPELGQFIETIPPTRRRRDTWYLGTADAVYQNLQSIEEERPSQVLILSADHVYKMDYRTMFEWHHVHKADVTVATCQTPPEEAWRYGIVEIGEDYRITGFEEKPQHGHPRRSRFNPEMCSVSMGVYLFNTPVLIEALLKDAEDESSSHDFGRDVLPKLIGRCRVIAYDFIDENRKEVRYWRDVGTIDSYYEANMDLVSVIPIFNLYDQNWPLRTGPVRMPPAKFVFADEGVRMGVALDSLVSHGCIISGGKVVHSVLSPGVRINSHALVEDSILHANAWVGRHCRIRRAIIEQGVLLPEHTQIGQDPEADRKAGHTVTESGIVVVHNASPGVREKRTRRPVPRALRAAK